jgi:pimeloyl-ACP methyl ester carboxylesterase
MVPHTPRLFALQILFAAASSPLPWTTEGFSIIGFSLGGGITMDFIAHNPIHMVRSVVLLGPAGLLRSLPESYEDLISASWSENRTYDGLRLKIAAALEVDADADPNPNARKGIQGTVDLQTVVQAQFLHHRGHVTSFISTVQHGPIRNQHSVWKKACEVLKSKYAEKEEKYGRKEELVVICGKDGVMPGEFIKEGLAGMMGQGEFVYEEVPGGHGFSLPQGGRIVEIIAKVWGL